MADDNHFTSLFDNLDEDRKGDKVYSDVTISVNNKLFPAHRCILGTFCLYFATLFQSSSKDKSNETIKLSGPIGEEIKPNTFQSILNFCYTKKSDLTANNVYDILSAAQFLQIDRLTTECLKYLTTLLSADNWLKIYRIALKWNYESLIDSCMDRFWKTETQINVKEFTFEEFYTVIKHSSEISESEKAFELISSWTTTHQDDKKQQRFDDLIQLVDFQSMKARYVSDKVINST